MLAYTVQDPSSSPGTEEYLLGCVANLYSQIPSRIPNANYNDPLPGEFHWVLIVSAVKVLSFELFNSRKAFQGQVSIRVMTRAHQDSIEDVYLLFPFTLSDHLPLARGREIRLLLHAAHCLELDIFEKVKFFGIHPEIL